MGTVDKAISQEIIELEYLQSQGHDEYEMTVTETVTRPIGPRLRELYKQLEETGKGPQT